MAKAELPNFKAGATLLIDKPLEWTSFDVVNKLKHKVKAKIGHAGTLDPLATGLLICCTGKHTKQIQEIQDADKVYEGEMYLGATTITYDREKEAENKKDISHLREADILTAVAKFTGEIEQFPPAYSAVKIDGERAYKKARRGEEVKTKSRKVTIHSFEITSIDLPLISFVVKCTKGTYIRTLANDLGQELGVGGYLHSLRRTAIGNYQVDDAWNLEEFVKFVEDNSERQEDNDSPQRS